MGIGQDNRRELSGLVVWGGLTVLIAFCFLWPPVVWAQTGDIKRVLILTQRDPLASPTTRVVGDEIVAQLRKSNYMIQIYSQAMGPVLAPDEATHLELRNWWLRKNQNAKPDVIVTVGTTPLVFLIEWGKKFFPDTPVIFVGALQETLGKHKPSSRFTGVWGKVEPAKTLDAALRLLPETRRVVVVGGMGLYDRHVVAVAREQFRTYEPKLEFIYLTDLDMPTLLDRVRSLPPNSIIYHAPITVDAAGTQFAGADQSLPALVSAAKVPIFSVYDLEIGKGPVGGSVESYALQGRMTGEMAARILNGERPQDIPPVTLDNIYLFDWRALKRWGLSEANLPPGSILINHEPTAWESYKWYILGGYLLLILEALLIFGLLWQRARTRKAERFLRESEERLRLMANAAPVLIWMAGVDKLCTYLNDAWLSFTGRPLESELGNGWLEEVHPEDLAACLDTYVQAFDRREAFSMEYRLRRQDGGYRLMLDRGVPRFDSNGSFTGYIGSAFDVTDRKKAEEALSGVSRRLIEAQEEERRYIARELHDDLGQRIALAAIEAQKLEDALPDSAAALRSQTARLTERILEVSSEVQSLSHRLHSSKLEFLGVVAAVKSFCNELAAQRKVEIRFEHSEVPRQLPQEISLCLFRVAQEALQNAVKHSGAREFSVELRGVPDAMLLSVRDSGIGFEINEAMHNHGIGLISMRERVGLVEGTISIDSKPMAGTEINVRIPVAMDVTAD